MAILCYSDMSDFLLLFFFSPIFPSFKANVLQCKGNMPCSFKKEVLDSISQVDPSQTQHLEAVHQPAFHHHQPPGSFRLLAQPSACRVVHSQGDLLLLSPSVAQTRASDAHSYVQKYVLNQNTTRHWESRTHNVKEEHWHSKCSGRRCFVQHRKATSGDGEGAVGAWRGRVTAPQVAGRPHPGADAWAGPQREGWAMGQKAFQSHGFHPGAALKRRILSQDYVNMHNLFIKKRFSSMSSVESINFLLRFFYTMRLSGFLFFPYFYVTRISFVIYFFCI